MSFSASADRCRRAARAIGTAFARRQWAGAASTVAACLVCACHNRSGGGAGPASSGVATVRAANNSPTAGADAPSRAVQPPSADAQQAPSTGSSGPAERVSSRPERQRVVIRTRDGWTLAGWLDRGTAPVWIVLVHQLSSDHSEWEPLAALVQHRAPPLPSVLTVDLRGHGASTAGPNGETRFPSFGTSTAAWSGVVVDVESAVRYLRTSAGAAATDRVYIVGSSIGSSATLRYAAGDPSVSGVVLLSPGLAYRGLDTLEPMQRFAASGRPALLITSDGDTGSAQAVPALVARAAGRPGVTSVVYGGSSAHGVSIATEGHPEMWTRVREWLDARSLEPVSAAATR